MIKVDVKPVYSPQGEKLFPSIIVPKVLNFDSTKSKLIKQFRNPDIDVVFNTAMTGDGKSLAAYLSALVDNRRVLAM